MAWFGRAGAVARQHNVQGTAIEPNVVMNDDCTETGGAAAIALATALSVRKRGIRVTFLSSGSAPDPRLIESGVENHCLGGRQLMEGSRPLAAVRGIFDVRSAAALSDWIRANDTPGTCYHLHNWHKALSPSIFGPLRSVSARLLMTAHDYFVACPNGGYFNYSRQQPCELIPASARCIVSDCDRRHYGHKVWRLARHRVRQAVFNFERAAAHVVAVHEGMVPYLERGGIPRGAIRVLRNPVRARRAERVMVERNSRVMFIGRLEEDKGVRQLALAARKAGLPLCVLGAGPLARYLKDEHPEVSCSDGSPRTGSLSFWGRRNLWSRPVAGAKRSV
jgi:glycosyltransferase involved in cell wall biosynthesis